MASNYMVQMVRKDPRPFKGSPMSAQSVSEGLQSMGPSCLDGF